MTERSDEKLPLSTRLLERERPVDPSKYEEYRMKLEVALDRAERNTALTYHLCWVSMIVAAALTFVGGSRIVGAFDPWDDRATPLSTALGVVYVVAAIIAAASFASYYSRMRPGVRRAKDDLRDAELAELRREVTELRGRDEGK